MKQWEFHFSLVGGGCDCYVVEDSSRSTGKDKKILYVFFVGPKNGKGDIPLQIQFLHICILGLDSNASC